jgi:hypothetical protein
MVKSYESHPLKQATPETAISGKGPQTPSQAANTTNE